MKEKAGVVAYKYSSDEEPLVLLVSARKIKGSWVFPVGGVDPGESLKTAAKRECEEESGYCVEIEKKISSVASCTDNKPTRFTFYLASVVTETDTWETDRTRKWVPVSQAKDAVPSIFQNVACEAAQYLSDIKK
ncbi:MAG: NUDIX domain-containing protein [Candidatus Electrothrix sp. AR4]|nr:NUDIX domain-containing protein [Candidatus Electrothrix sp. AR4]